MTATHEPTTADLLLDWDRQRPRSKQRELGWSEVGGCRRRAGYRLAGTEPTNPGGSVQAVLGTAIHEAVQARLAETAGPEDLVEHEVTFAGILGHLDRYEADTASVVDVKTTTSRWLEHIKVHGPDRTHLWQINGYAAALTGEGHTVRRVVLDFIARDTGEVWRWSDVPKPFYVKDALEWLRAVRAVPVEMLNRDYDPDGPFCAHCPFYDTCWQGGVPDRNARSVILVEGGDQTAIARRLFEIREELSELKAAEKEAKDILDGLRPNDSGKGDVVDVGLGDLGLQWTISKTTRLDTDAVKAEYARTGEPPPSYESTSTRLAFVPLPEETT
jgi:hypothetical protein